MRIKGFIKKYSSRLLINSKGVSLPEVTISLMILAIAVYGYLELRQRVAIREKSYTSEVNLMKLLLSLKDQVLVDDEYIVPHPSKDDTYWNDVGKSDYRCFDAQGTAIPHATAEANLVGKSLTGLPSVNDDLDSHPKVDMLKTGVCQYFLTFYKTGMVVAGRNAPIAQYHMKLAYFIGGPNGKRAKLYTLRPLKTAALYY